jgi:hypothetical protein
VTTPFSRSVGSIVAVLVCLVLLGGTAACTSDTDRRTPTPKPAPAASTGTSPTIKAKPVPMEVEVTRVSGTLRKAARRSLERKVGRTISAYFDDAHLGGSYPRSTFRGSFGSFSGGAARMARQDLDLLTNAVLGASTVAVVPRRKTARLAVLAPRRVAAGVTARVRLVYVAERDGAADRVVSVFGRLLLTRSRPGGWEIFGYDLSRTTRPAAKGPSR